MSKRLGDLGLPKLIQNIKAWVRALLSDYRSSDEQDVIDSGKVDKITGKGLSTNDYTDADKTKVANALTEHQSLSAYSTTAQMETAIAAHHDSTKQDVISDLATIRSGAAAGTTAVQPSALTSYATASALSSEVSARESADNSLQGQIDAITSQSDVVDVVGTKAELLAYSKPLYVDDIVKVLVDESQQNAITYYRWKGASASPTWQYIGASGPYYSKSETDSLLNGKQATISDLATIRAGAAAGANAVQPEAGKGLFSGNYNDLTNKPTIPSAVTESTVSGWGFTKNTGTYSKPSTGIPKTDLASAVQTSLGKADTAYQKASSGIPKTDLVSAVQTSLGKADTAYQKASTGIPKTDLASAVQTSLGKADSAYQKPSGGIPATDLTSSVQTTLNSLANKQDKPAQVTSGTTITLADNTEYTLSNVSTLTLTYPSGNFECWLKITTTSSSYGTIKITLPTSTYIGDKPAFAKGETWELSIKNKVVVAAKAVS